MLRIQKLVKPTKKKSGFRLEPGKTTKMRGLTVVNTNSYAVYVDKYTRKKSKPKKKKSAKK